MQLHLKGDSLIRAILFDLDGVLIEARSWHEEAFLKALAAHGVSVSGEFHKKNLEGQSTPQKLAILRERGMVASEQIPGITRLKQTLTDERIESFCGPDPAIARILSDLKQWHVPIAICTNSARRTAEKILARMNVRHEIDVLLSNGDVARPKPDPEIFLAAGQRLNIPMHHCLVIEDSDVGSQSALASGANLARVESPGDLVAQWSKILSLLEARTLPNEAA